MISDMFVTFNDTPLPKEYDNDLLPSFALSVLKKAPKHEKLTIGQLIRRINEGVNETAYSYHNKATIQSAIPFLVQGGFASVTMGVSHVGVMGHLIFE